MGYSELNEFSFAPNMDERHPAADNTARLSSMSEDMRQVASTLARLSARPGPDRSKPEAPAVDAGSVRAALRARRIRSRFFPEELFADPAWDMLLNLLDAEISQIRMPLSSLCTAAGVPAATALRWIKTMTELGLFVRRPDPYDGRRMFVELAPSASDALRRYFAEAGKSVAA